MWATALPALRDLGTLVVTIPAITCAATALVLLGTDLVAQHRAIELNGVVTVWVAELLSWSDPLGMMLALLATLLTEVLALLVSGLLAVSLIHGLSAGRVGEPRRSAPRVSNLLPSLATGIAVSLVIVVPVSLLTFDLVGGLTTAVSFGTLVGLGRWITAPVVEQTATSPESVLRSDRSALFLTVGTVAVAVTVLVGGLGWAFGSGDDLLLFLIPANVNVTVVVLVAVGSSAPWLCYTVTRLWLALWGQLPWRLTRFLRHAHTAGVLRQAGPAYQFRHDMLRAYLADHGPPTRRCGLIVQPSDPTRCRPVLRRWRWWRRLAGIGIAISLLPVTTGLIIPNPLQASLRVDDFMPMPSIAFSLDGTLAIGGRDGTVQLWDPTTCQLRRILTTDGGIITSLAFSPDGSTLATGERDGRIRLRDSASGQPRYTFITDTASVDSVAFNPNGSTLASASNGVIRLWNVAMLERQQPR